MAGYQDNELREYAENGLTQVTNLLNRRDYNSSVAKARQVAERIVRNYAEEKKIPFTTFAETIEQLFSSGTINMTSRDSFHALRLYGNKAARDGDCTEEDARNAFYNLNTEVQTWKSRNAVNPDRTPVRVDRNSLYSSSAGMRDDAGAQSGNSYRMPSSSRNNDNDNFTESIPVRVNRQRRLSQSSGRVSSSSSSTNRRSQRRNVRQYSGRESQQGSLDVFSIVKVLIPIIILILIIVILVSLFRGSGGESSSPSLDTSASETESTTLESETETTTEAVTEPPVVEYQIKGTNVNIRYAENTDRVYTQLSTGYNIGEVQDMEGTNYAQFTLDGLQVVVSKDYIEPIETEGNTSVSEGDLEITEGGDIETTAGTSAP